MCHCAANLGAGFFLVSDVDDFSDFLLGDRVEADNAAIEGVVELEVLFLRNLHVHNVDRVVVMLHMSVSFVLLVWICVQEVDRRQVNCLSSSVSFEAVWCEPSFFDGCFVLGRPDVVELFRMAWSQYLLR